MFVFISLIILALIFRIWFFSTEILTHGDWMFFYLQTQKELFSLPYIWTTSGLGGIDIGLTMYPINFLWGLLAQMGLGFGFSERALYMMPSLVLGFTGTYFLARFYNNSRIASITGALIFTLNTYFMVGRTAHLTLIMSFSLASYILYFLATYLKTNNYSSLLLTILFSILASYYEFRAFYIIAGVIILFVIFNEIFIVKKINYKKIIIVVGCIFLSILLSNLFWIIPFQNTQFLTSNEFVTRELFGNDYMSIDKSLALFHPFWTGKEVSEFIVQPIPVYMWIIPIISFVGVLLNRKKKIIVFFTFITLLGIFLSKQSNPPFSSLYGLFYSYVPGFSAFREASKFYFLIALGYSMLSANFINYIQNNKRISYITFLSITSVVILSTLIHVKPVITNELGSLFVPRTISQDYERLHNIISKEDVFYRTLWVPRDSRWSFYSQRHPKVNLIESLNSVWHDFSIETKYAPEVRINSFISDPSFLPLVNLSSVRYIIIPLKDKSNDDNFFTYYGDNRASFIQSVKDKNSFEDISNQFQDVAVFRNITARPKLYSTVSEERLNNNQPYSKITYNIYNPTFYTLELNNVTSPVYVHFTEQYHEDWFIKPGSLNWLDILLNKNKNLSKAFHFENEAKMNSFKIDPEFIMNNFEKSEYTINQDGSMDITLSLYFHSQMYAYVGVIISAISVALFVILFIFSIIKDGFKKKSY